jgi:hypothetical protein
MPQTRFWPEEPADLWGSPGVGWEIGGLWEALGLALESGGYSTEVELYRTTVCQALCVAPETGTCSLPSFQRKKLRLREASLYVGESMMAGPDLTVYYPELHEYPPPRSPPALSHPCCTLLQEDSCPPPALAAPSSGFLKLHTAQCSSTYHGAHCKWKYC